jgi:hypothetical protein
MRRRDFVCLPATLAAPAPFSLEGYFRRILDGYAKAAQATSASLAVVEYPKATVNKSFQSVSGLSATGVTRMLPALAAWVAGGHDDGTAQRLALEALRHGADPRHPDYWQAAAPERSDQRQVEASIVAWSLYLLRDLINKEMTQAERDNITAWLRSCTRRPVRTNNWAWFTAVVQAVLLVLDGGGNEKEMLADLEFLDTLAAGNSGWYNDDPHGAAYDFYNAWVFASHFLYWNEVIGARYPAWRDKFQARLRPWLELAPCFFDARGHHVLYGRSLIYRWAILTPLTLAHRQKLWPHPPGLLRRIVTRNIAWQASIGGLDETNGKLRESLTPEGTLGIRETYIDGGHPYWGMQAWVFWTYPRTDSFWTAPETSLPVERDDFRRPVPEAGLLFAGHKKSGQVRLYNARSTRTEPTYRDKYNKFVFTTAHPFTVVHDPAHPTADNTLLLRKGDKWAARREVRSSTVSGSSISLTYDLALDSLKLRVETVITLNDGTDRRHHQVTVEAGDPAGFELVEGSVAARGRPKVELVRGWQTMDWTASPASVTEDKLGLWLLKAPVAPNAILESRHSW